MKHAYIYILSLILAANYLNAIIDKLIKINFINELI